MSWENNREAWRTRLGNPTAKQVLVLIVDEANAEGLAFAGLQRIATLTEVNKRTVQRMLQIFSEIGLVSRTEASLKGRTLPAFQVDLVKLGLDLADEFSACMNRVGGKRRSDAEGGVAATRRSVAATRGDVAATHPPDPLLGGPLLFPVMSQTPQPPLRAKGASELDRAVDQVVSALGISNRRKRKPIGSAIKLAMEKGEPAPTVALAMIAAVREQDTLHLRRALKFKYGLEKFIGGGIWRDRNRWGWDPHEMQLQANASVGSAR